MIYEFLTIKRHFLSSPTSEINKRKVQKKKKNQANSYPPSSGLGDYTNQMCLQNWINNQQ